MAVRFERLKIKVHTSLRTVHQQPVTEFSNFLTFFSFGNKCTDDGYLFHDLDI